jgi:hypothetical protein
MSVEGRIDIALGGEAGVSLTSTRPLGIARAFRGRNLAETIASIALLFPICGFAHGVVAAWAAEQALCVAPRPGTETARALLVLAETWREHMIRVVLDWPRSLRRISNVADAALVMQTWERLRAAIDPAREAVCIGADLAPDAARLRASIAELELVGETLALGESSADFVSRGDEAALSAWEDESDTPAQVMLRHVSRQGWDAAGDVSTYFLRKLPAAELRARLFGADAASFVATPDWQSKPRETGPFARQHDTALISDLRAHHGNGLRPRLAATLLELATLPGRMRAVLEAGPDDAAAELGVAQIEAARGRLVHALEIEGGIVRRYAILAPTEWNFHKQGAAAHALAGIARLGASARPCAELFVMAVDPCVAATVRMV